MILIVLVTVVLVFVMLEFYFNSAAIQISEQANERTAKTVKQNIDAYMEEMIMTAERMEELYLHMAENAYVNGVEFVIRKDIDTISVFDEQGNLLINSDSRILKPQAKVSQESWFQKGQSAKADIVFTEPHVQRLYESSYPWVISMVKKIKDEEKAGIVLVDMNFKNIKELCTSKDVTDGEVYIVDSKGSVIFHPNQQMLYAGIQDESIPHALKLKDQTEVVSYGSGKHVISVYGLTSNDWSVVVVNDMKWFDAIMENTVSSMAGLVLFILSVILLLSVVSAFFISRPLKRLVRLMATAERGDFSVRAKERGYYEVVELTQSFNSMIHRISQLLEDVKKEHALLRKSEMKTLHEQINSHFLYNTLDSVIWMSEVDDKTNAIKMLKALSKFFRLSLSRGKEMIPLEEEVRHVENYLIIQKMRYGEAFEYEILMDQDILHLSVLKMVLQPIVENSVLHGFQGMSDEGMIRIHGSRTAGKLLLSVQDNGCGIRAEKLERILEIDPVNKTGVGIKNVNERIRLMFGEGYGLSYESQPDFGTKVEIRLPVGLQEETKGQG